MKGSIVQTLEGTTIDNYWGACPKCHETDGYLNWGSDHWFYCKQHKSRWCIGSSLFSSWMDETKEEQERIINELDFRSFKVVKPFYDPVALPEEAPKDEIPMIPPESPSPAQSGEETPITSREYNIFVSQRATKIIRDKLPKAGMKDLEASTAVKNYLMKNSGKTNLKLISAAVFERLIGALEAATPEQAAEMVNRSIGAVSRRRRSSRTGAFRKIKLTRRNQ
jgi:hypothetical protein